jgi:hypothetical protein
MRNGEGGTVPSYNVQLVTATAHDAQGRSGAYLADAFAYDAYRDCFTCSIGQTLTHQATLNRDNGVRTRVYKAPKTACRDCIHRDECSPKNASADWRRSITRHEEPASTTSFKAKMQAEQARQIYATRSRIAGFPHAWIKERCRLRQFRCRGRVKATVEATWACLSYNLARWFSVGRQSIKAALATA